MYKRMQLLRPHSAAKRRAHCTSAKSASAAAGVYVYDPVYMSHMVYCHTEYMKVYMYIPIFNNYTNVGAHVCVSVCVGAGARLMSTEQQLFIPSEKVQANPNRHCKDTCWLGTAGMLGDWALQGYLAVRHCKDTFRSGNTGVLCNWALQGLSAVEHCKDTLRLGTAGNVGDGALPCGWALQRYLGGILGGWALRRCSTVGHCGDI